MILIKSNTTRRLVLSLRQRQQQQNIRPFQFASIATNIQFSSLASSLPSNHENGQQQQQQRYPLFTSFFVLPTTTTRRRRITSLRFLATDTTTKTGESNEFDDPQLVRADHAHCVDLVQKRDVDGYLCGLLMPSHSRKAYFAIRAFNVEIASTLDGGGISRIRQQQHGMMGDDDNNITSLGSRMRMQWWRESLADIYNTTSEDDEKLITPSPAGFLSTVYGGSGETTRHQNPVVRALKRAINEKQLTRRFLERLMDARENQFDIKQPSTIHDVLRYSEATSSSLLYLSLECCGVREESADFVASDIGVGIGLVTTLRSTAFLASRGELSLPSELMKKHSVPARYLLDPPQRNASGDIKFKEDDPMKEQQADVALNAAVRELAMLSAAYLSKARDAQIAVPREGRPCLLPAVLALHYLQRLERIGFDVLHPRVNVPDTFSARFDRLGATFLLLRASLTGV